MKNCTISSCLLFTITKITYNQRKKVISRKQNKYKFNYKMLKLIGVVNTIIATIEPPLEIASTSNSGGNTSPYSNNQTNLAVFMILFMLCAIEVVFIKIVTAVEDIDGNFIDDTNNNRIIISNSGIV